MDTNKITISLTPGSDVMSRFDDLGRVSIPQQLRQKWDFYGSMPLRLRGGVDDSGRQVVIVSPYNELSSVRVGDSIKVNRALCSLLASMNLKVKAAVLDSGLFQIMNRGPDLFPAKALNKVIGLSRSMKSSHQSYGIIDITAESAEGSSQPISLLLTAISAADGACLGYICAVGDTESVEQCRPLAELAASFLSEGR